LTQGNSAPQKPVPTETVVIAEDSLPNRKILQHLLEKINYNVVACPNGKDAWEKLKELAAKNVGAVLADLMMPDEDGMALLKKIRADDQLKHLPFVFITAVSDKYLVKMAKENGVQGYILKPVTYLNVCNKMRELFPTRDFPRVAS